MPSLGLIPSEGKKLEAPQVTALAAILGQRVKQRAAGKTCFFAALASVKAAVRRVSRPQPDRPAYRPAEPQRPKPLYLTAGVEIAAAGDRRLWAISAAAAVAGDQLYAAQTAVRPQQKGLALAAILRLTVAQRPAGDVAKPYPTQSVAGAGLRPVARPTDKPAFLVPLSWTAAAGGTADGRQDGRAA